ncbi:MAG: hypothetical protein H0W88_09410 [Parachlamydiaceae bacterium]|nr:hypothetical protein [Parachlamydiaceae bacterium]
MNKNSVANFFNQKFALGILSISCLLLPYSANAAHASICNSVSEDSEANLFNKSCKCKKDNNSLFEQDGKNTLNFVLSIIRIDGAPFDPSTDFITLSPFVVLPNGKSHRSKPKTLVLPIQPDGTVDLSGVSIAINNVPAIFGSYTIGAQVSTHSAATDMTIGFGVGNTRNTKVTQVSGDGLITSEVDENQVTGVFTYQKPPIP